jgi:hypothetical protein
MWKACQLCTTCGSPDLDCSERLSMPIHGALNCCLHLRFELVYKPLCQPPVAEVICSCRAAALGPSQWVHMLQMPVLHLCWGQSATPASRLVLHAWAGHHAAASHAHLSASRSRPSCMTAGTPVACHDSSVTHVGVQLAKVPHVQHVTSWHSPRLAYASPCSQA